MAFTGKTVAQRAQENGGFVAGPTNRMVNQRMGQPMMQPEQASAPNYREAEDPEQACLDCGEYDQAMRQCKKYQFDARPHWVCDDFRPDGAEGMENARAESFE